MLSRCLADECQAWHVSQRVKIPNLEAVAKTHGIRVKGSIKNVRRIDEQRTGPRVLLEDQVRTSGWVLASHGGFITHCHHDAEGFGTYVIFNCGAKIWALSEPQLESPVPTREELYRKFDTLILQDEEPSFERHVAGTILLEHGDVL